MSSSKSFALVGVLLITLFGCATTAGVGHYETLSAAEQRRMLEEIKKNWKDYHIYSCGPAGTTSAVIFSPKSSARRLIGDRYLELKDEESVSLAINIVNSYHSYNPRLYTIRGEEGAIYGYVLIAFYLPRPSRVDERTLMLPHYLSPLYFDEP
jgi:hypothetical protein